MKHPALTARRTAPASLARRIAALLAVAVLLARASGSSGSELSLTEYQVKSLCLLNFTKYIEWPPGAFTATNSPIIIGICGENVIGDDLQKIVASKIVGGRRIVVRPFTAADDPGQCQVLFISIQEKKRLAEILDKVRSRPVLTVGENESFFEAGGVINFAIKDGKVRFEVNLEAARQANLQVSSKLLSIADMVKGKTR